MTNPDADLADKLTAEAEHAESTRDAELAYERRRPGPSGHARTPPRCT